MLSINNQLKLTLLLTILMVSSFTVNAVTSDRTVRHKTIDINGIEIFYREAGNPQNPTLLLLHGYPTSSHMFRNLMRDLSDEYYLVAPDYPGFGRSEQPPMQEFEYSFHNLAVLMESFIDQMQIDKFSIYLMDYGAPIGYRIATKHPDRVQALIVQNGLTSFWDPIRKYWNDYTPENGKPLEVFHSLDGLKWQYTHGVKDTTTISPDNWMIDLQHLTRPGNNEIQLALFYDYRTNVVLYPEWQAYLRAYQPPTLIVWGKNDHIFPAEGAYPYQRDLKNVQFNLLDTGHFALEEQGAVIAQHMRNFLKQQNVK